MTKKRQNHPDFEAHVALTLKIYDLHIISLEWSHRPLPRYQQSIPKYLISRKSEKVIFSWPIIDYSSKFKVTWFGNGNRYQKSVLTDFRYCPILWCRERKLDLPTIMVEEIEFQNREKTPKSRLSGSRDLDLEVIWPSYYIVGIVSSRSIHIPKIVEIKRKKVGRTDGRTAGRTGIPYL